MAPDSKAQIGQHDSVGPNGTDHCRTYFPQDYTGIRVFNRRKSSIRVDLKERLFFAFIKLDKLVFERDAELFENEVYLAVNCVSHLWPGRTRLATGKC